MDPELIAYLRDMEARLSDRLERSEARMNERFETVETRLLTEFHKWASPMDARVRSHTAAIRALDLEVESLADRVTHLDGGSKS